MQFRFPLLLNAASWEVQQPHRRHTGTCIGFTGLPSYLIAAGMALFLCSCTGSIGSSPGSDAEEPQGTAGAGSPSGKTGESSAAFRPASDSLQLLPFEARLTKLANVLGLPKDDAIFSELRAQRRELGAYDYAQGIAPDLSWSAKRIAGWIKALRPVCDASAMKQRYPTMTGEVDELVMRAHGRRATQDDKNDLASVPSSLDGTARYRVMCIGFLASAEFLAP